MRIQGLLACTQRQVCELEHKLQVAAVKIESNTIGCDAVLSIKREVEGYIIKNTPYLRENWRMLNQFSIFAHKWQTEAHSVHTSRRHMKMMGDSIGTQVRNQISINLVRQQNEGAVRFETKLQLLQFPGAISTRYDSMVAS